MTVDLDANKDLRLIDILPNLVTSEDNTNIYFVRVSDRTFDFSRHYSFFVSTSAI